MKNDLPLPTNDITPLPHHGELAATGEAMLTEDEGGFILDTCLSNSRRGDPVVISFIEAFMRSKNILQASQEVGITPREGKRLRNLKDVSLAIQKLTDRSAVKYGFDASEVVERAKEIVDFDPIMLQNPDGTYKKSLHDIPPEARRVIKKIKVKNIWGKQPDLNGIDQKIITGELIEVEFYDKLKATEMIGKEKELFKTTSKVEHTVSKDMKSLLLNSVKRAESVIQVNENGERSDEV